MKHVSYLAALLFFVPPLFAQIPEWQCQTVDSTLDPLSLIKPMIEVTQPLIIILIDFPDGRIQPGNIIPTVDADTALIQNIDGTGGMGYVQVGPPPLVWKKKIRKYVYEDYWNMIFSAVEYTGTVHPDYFTHLNYDPDGPGGEDPWDLTVYGSMYDYYNEVSDHNMLLDAYPTRSGGSSMYYRGIVNKIDEANGKNYVRWIMLPQNKSYYETTGDPIAAARAEVDRLHHNLDPDHPDYIEFDIRTYPSTGKICVIAAGGGLGGWTYFLGAQPYIATEKTHGFRNTSPGAVLDGIQQHVHEFGHTIRFAHFIGGSYETMHWGGLGHRRHYWCPPHMNPLSKILAGWIREENIIHVRTNSPVTLGPVHSSAQVALVDVYGEAGRNGNYGDHSEYLLIEFRKREGFNRFAGGPIIQDPDFTGGGLVWHYSTIQPFPISGQVVERRLGLKVVGYGQSFMGNPGNPTHFYPYHGTPLDSATNPNSHSTSNLVTGLSMNSFNISGGFLSFNVAYQLDPPPLYNMFLYPGSSVPTSWSGTIYNQLSNVSQVQIISAGSVVESRSGCLMQPGTLQAIGTINQPITFRGIGYGNHRLRWSELQLQTNNATNIPQVRHSVIKNATIGTNLLGNGTMPSPIVRNTSFEDCLTDIRVFGQTGSNAFELAGLDSNTFVSVKMLRNTKLSSGDFVLPSTATLYLGEPGYEANITVSGNNTFTVNGQLVFGANATIAGDTWRFGASITVPQDRTLTLQPGTVLSFGSGTSLIINGNLYANGNEGNFIYFASSSPTPAAGDWNGILVSDSYQTTLSLGYAQITHTTGALTIGEYANFTMNDCVVGNSFIGLQITPRVGEGPSVPSPKYITNNTFTNVIDGIILNTTAETHIDNNTLSGLWFPGNQALEISAGVRCIGSSPEMLRNDIENFGNGLHCLDGSSPVLQDQTSGGYNVIRNNHFGVKCEDQSDAILGSVESGDEGGMNSIYGSETYDVVLINKSVVYAQNNWWGSADSSDFRFSIDENSQLFYVPWLDYDPNGGNRPLTMGSDPVSIRSSLTELQNARGQGYKGEEPQMLNPVRESMRRALNERIRRRYNEALLLIKAIIANGELPVYARRWAVSQLVPVSQRLPNPNLSGYLRFTGTLHPELISSIRAAIPQSYILERRFTEAIAAYDTNIQRYPNSDLECTALYGKFVLTLFSAGDTTQARTLYNTLAALYSSSTERYVAEIQLANYQINSTPESSPLMFGDISNVTSETPETSELPKEFGLSQNYPNPFNPSTIINFRLPVFSWVTLKVYDVLGKEVAKLIDEPKESGYYFVAFDASQLSSGIYFYSMIARPISTGSTTTFAQVKKLVFIR